MNSLTKIQSIMFISTLTLLAAFFINLLLLVPAAIMIFLQIPLFRSELRVQYPEDWRRYSLLFIAYEAALVGILFFILTVPIALGDISAILNLFLLILTIIILTIVLKFFVSRRYCYGTVLFACHGWVGVYVRSDLFSKIKEANYAIKNDLDAKVREGDRVKISMKGSFGKAMPYALVEVTK